MIRALEAAGLRHVTKALLTIDNFRAMFMMANDIARSGSWSKGCKKCEVVMDGEVSAYPGL